MINSIFNLKRSVGQREGCVCGGAGQGSLLHIHARRATTHNSPLFQGVATPPQACHSRCSVIHPVGDHNFRSYFLQNQIPVIRMERSTDFF
ncbi:MAG: hypothetical protein P8179_19840, partial [Candidatus Thiodiazotropha sp.]